MEHLLKTTEENLASWRTKGKHYFRLSFAIVRPIFSELPFNERGWRKTGFCWTSEVSLRLQTATGSRRNRGAICGPAILRQHIS
jgi:hypothetical protein